MPNQNNTAHAHLVGVLSTPSSLSGHLNVAQTITGTISISDRIPSYNGEYEVTPQCDDAVVLPTSGKAMKGDLTVKSIPYYETTNLSGGYTVIIG